jgi:very-short-patch-repair endonuclease
MSKKEIKLEDSFAQHPKAKYWSDKNGDIKPKDIYKGSKEKFWFNCDCGHEIYKRIYDVKNNEWCSYCCKPSKSLCNNDDCKTCYEKSFASHEKSKFWSKNNELKPRQILRKSDKKGLFNCTVCNHEFETQIKHITDGVWCNYCSNRKLCKDDKCEQCFEKSFASHKKSQYWSDKNELKPREVMLGTHDKYLFNCICGHEFSKQITDIKNNEWCGYCSNPPKLLCTNNDCKHCYEKSFASQEKAKYWNNKNELNPRQIFKSSSVKAIFNCNKCTHTFEKRICNVFMDVWCPYCAIPSKIVCENRDCIECYKRSFASHEKSKYWSIKNELKPRQVLLNTKEKFIFDCECGHEFNKSLCGINDNGWCGYCSNPPKFLCNDTQCKNCFDKSFASHEKSKYWNIKNDIKPREIFKSANKKYSFICEKNHEFESSPNNIINGRWCPNCVNKTEQKLYEQLIKIYKTLGKQLRVEWCKNKNNKYLPFDFVLEEHKIIIELDGLQHFEQISHWLSPKERQCLDKYKMDVANKNGYSVIRILQEDVYEDKYDWLKELDDNIKKIIKKNKILNIYMCKKNEYDVYL